MIALWAWKERLGKQIQILELKYSNSWDEKLNCFIPAMKENGRELLGKNFFIVFIAF